MAKYSHKTPDFGQIHNSVLAKYNLMYAERVTLHARVEWYSYLIAELKRTDYWHKYIDYKIKDIEIHDLDKISEGSIDATVNNVCWFDIFMHSSDEKQLKKAIQFMKSVVAHEPTEYGEMDTYACVLYKAGRVNEAMKWEESAAQIAKFQNDDLQSNQFKITLEKMKKGEKIWLEKGYYEDKIH